MKELYISYMISWGTKVPDEPPGSGPQGPFKFVMVVLSAPAACRVSRATRPCRRWAVAGRAYLFYSGNHI